MDLFVDNQLVDFGTLSARTIVTGSDGIARVVYTAPPAPPGGVASVTTVTVRATPIGSDAQTTNQTFHADINLMPVGVIVPPTAKPIPAFTFLPTAVGTNVPVTFDASASLPGDPSQPFATSIAAYSWDFGDGTTGSGRIVTHVYTVPATYNVVLTVTNNLGLSASLQKAVTVSDIDPFPGPETWFTSPIPAIAGQQLFFNASLIKPLPGRFIVSYEWSFGDGTTGAGSLVTHTFAQSATYQVVLTVTDDLGRRKSFSQPVTVGTTTGGGTGLLTANFTWNDPQSPTHPASVTFNGGASTAPAGSQITTYTWTFSDTGGQATGLTTTHNFASAGTFQVTLTVIDNQGQSSAPSTKSIVIQ